MGSLGVAATSNPTLRRTSHARPLTSHDLESPPTCTMAPDNDGNTCDDVMLLSAQPGDGTEVSEGVRGQPRPKPAPSRPAHLCSIRTASSWSAGFSRISPSTACRGAGGLQAYCVPWPTACWGQAYCVLGLTHHNSVSADDDVWGLRVVLGGRSRDDVTSCVNPPPRQTLPGPRPALLLTFVGQLHNSCSFK